MFIKERNIKFINALAEIEYNLHKLQDACHNKLVD